MTKFHEIRPRSAASASLSRHYASLAIAAIVFGAALLAAPLTASAAAAVPCEDMLAQLRAAKAGVALSAADQAKLDGFEAKGIERCNADDDKRADDFFKQAMALLGK
ncbi:hypothetical protein [Kaistia terrae]|uniref:Secreted protein n=1 Tax=Kaistia terrae TaxID=537017 RepID=A0ABW0Q375_9HYPH|nr:hypothetical protein [Kaistia terrae]MCX5579628.1 hypothetical protein [Kaistia terrae]